MSRVRSRWWPHRLAGAAAAVVLAAPAAFAQNAAEIYQRVGKSVPKQQGPLAEELSQVIQHGWQGEHPALRDLLAENAESIATFIEATRLPHCEYLPASTPMHAATQLPSLMGEFAAVRLVLLRGRQAESEGRLREAAEDYLAAVRFAQHIGGQEHPASNGKMMEILTKAVAFMPVRDAMRHPAADAPTVRYLLESLVALRRASPGMERVFMEEAESAKNTLRLGEWRVRKQSKFRQRAYDAMCREYDRLVDEQAARLLEAYRNNDEHTYQAWGAAFIDQVKKETRLWGGTTGVAALSQFGLPFGPTPQLAARDLAAAGMPTSIVIMRHYAMIADFDALIAATGVRLHELEKGETPESLDQLVPGYLAAVPADPFDGFRPMRFLKRGGGWVVYSIGPDRIDEQAGTPYEFGPARKGDIFTASRNSAAR